MGSLEGGIATLICDLSDHLPQRSGASFRDSIGRKIGSRRDRILAPNAGRNAQSTFKTWSADPQEITLSAHLGQSSRDAPVPPFCSNPKPIFSGETWCYPVVKFTSPSQTGCQAWAVHISHLRPPAGSRKPSLLTAVSVEFRDKFLSLCEAKTSSLRAQILSAIFTVERSISYFYRLEALAH